MGQTQISAVIITFNEAKNIAACIDALLPIADEIVVVDSFSSDLTPQICAEKGVVFHQSSWNGFSAAKNLGNQLSAHEYILSIDADERPDDQLKHEIQELKKSGLNGAYGFRRKNFYGLKWVRYGGWYPDWKIRLFDKNKWEWTGDFVHETLKNKFDERITNLNGHLLHYTINDRTHHSLTIHKYAKLAAQKVIEKGDQMSAISSVLSTLSTFIKIYFIKFGILDGRTGLFVALNSSKSKWIRFKYFQQLKKA